MQVTIENVTKLYGRTCAVKDFSTTLEDGHLICLLGPSGCGKSTVLNMLCGIVSVTSGKIFFDGEDVTAMPPDKRHIGMVFQNYALYPHMTVQDNIAFPLEMQNLSRSERRERAVQAASLVRMDSYLNRYPRELSGGQQQRVAIARALVKNPRLLLMDEPLSNLDARLRLEMREEIRRIQQETGVTTVFVTHDQEEAMSISDSILLMKEGVLVQSGASQQLYENPRTRFVADFLGNPPVNTFEDGHFEARGVGLDFVFNGCAVPLPQKIVSALKNFQTAGRTAVLAVRPEAFMCADGGKEEDTSFEAAVTRVSLLGREQIVYVRLGNIECRIVLDSSVQGVAGHLIAGEHLLLSLKNTGVFVFDSGTGERLA